MSEDSQIDRRRFAERLIAGTGCLTVGFSAVPAVGEEVPPPPKLPTDADPSSDPPLELLLLTYLVRNYPSEKFDDAALQGIFRDIRGDVARGKVLSEFPLKNSDEPAFVFGAYRAPDAP